MNCIVSNDSIADYGDCRGSIDELKVPQLQPSVKRDNTVRELFVWYFNKHLIHLSITISGLFTCRKSTATVNRQKNQYIPFLFQYNSQKRVSTLTLSTILSFISSVGL